MEELSREEMLKIFKDTMFDREQIKQRLIPVPMTVDGHPAMIYNSSFFEMFSTHPHYRAIIEAILGEVFNRYYSYCMSSALISNGEKQDVWCDILKQVFMESGLN